MKARFEPILFACALFLPACFTKPGTQGLPCAVDSDCDPGQMCIASVCAADGATNSGTTSSTATSETTATTVSETTVSDTTEFPTTAEPTQDPTEGPTTGDPSTDTTEDTETESETLCDVDECGTTGAVECLNNSCGANDPTWVLTISGDNYNLTGVAANQNGELFIAGHATGPITIGEAQLVAPGANVFVARLNPTDGSIVWTKFFQSSNTVVATDLEAGNEDVFVLGRNRGNLNGTGDPLSALDDDVFVIRLTPNEADPPVWATTLTTNGYQDPKKLSVSETYGVFIGGIYTSLFEIDEEAPPAADGSSNVFVTRLDHTNGTKVYAKGFGDMTSYQDLSGVAALQAGALAIGGTFSAPFSIHNVDFPMGATQDAFFAGLTNNGSGVDWDIFVGGAGAQVVRDIVSTGGDSSNCIYAVGQYSGSVMFGDTLLESLDAETDPFVFKSCLGVIGWAYGFPAGGAFDTAGTVERTGSDGFVMSGAASATIDFGGGLLTPAGIDDGFVARFDADGQHIWSIMMGSDNGPQQFEGAGALATLNGGVVVSGTFYDNVQIGGTLASGPAGARSHYIALIPD